MRFYAKSKKKAKFIKKLIAEGKDRTEICEIFTKKYDCHFTTFYDLYHKVTTGTESGKRLNHRKKRLATGKCYFCDKTEECKHHINYKYDITIPLCNSCHRKLHHLLENLNFS